MRYYAHSGSLSDLSDGQPLQEHLREVARRAEQFARQVRPGDDLFAEAARSAGLLHDVGKYQPEWQKYLEDAAAKRPTTSVPHAIHGAAYAAYTLGHQALCIAILGHHAGLADFDKVSNELDVRHTKLAPLVGQLISAAKGECPEIPSAMADHPLEPDNQASRRRYG